MTRYVYFKVMRPVRLTAAQRRTMILNEARRAFSRAGFEGVTTKDIARTLQISETLIYKHFPTKLALYHAVLRRVVRNQYAPVIPSKKETSPADIVRCLRGFFRAVTGDAPEDVKEGFRLLLASVSSDASYAGLIYRRANRILNERVNQALLIAREQGQLDGRAISAQNALIFTDHIGVIMNSLVSGSQSKVYLNDGNGLADDAVWFCARGLGFKDDAIAAYLAAPIQSGVPYI